MGMQSKYSSFHSKFTDDLDLEHRCLAVCNNFLQAVTSPQKIQSLDSLSSTPMSGKDGGVLELVLQ